MSEVDDLKALVKDLLATIQRQEKMIEAQRQRIVELEATVERLEDANRRLLHWRFGHRTEKSTEPGQLFLAIEGLSSDIDYDAELAGEPLKMIPERIVKPKRKRALWSELCPNLRIEDVRLHLPASVLFDDDGTPLVAMGFDIREELVYTPGCVHIRRVIRQRYGRSDTAEKILTAPVPPRIVTRGSLADETILAMIVHHAMDCLPYQRIAEMVSRLGAPVSRDLVTNACNTYAALAEPMLDAMQHDILQTNVLHIDGSFLFHQDRTKRRRCRRRPLYALSDGRQVVMRWRPDEKYETAADLIPGYHGYLVRDAWAGWLQLNHVCLTHVGCHAHARRYFAQTQDVDDDSKHIVALYQELYAIEHHANDSGRAGEALHAYRRELRQHYTVPILNRICAFAEDRRRVRSGPMKTHLNYILKHRESLSVFLTDGALPPDNNLAERVLRRNAMLRKNRLFYVGADCGQHIGTLLSLMVTCRELELNPLDYLIWSLPALLAYRDQHGTAEQPDLNKWTPLAYQEHLQAEIEIAA